MRNNHYTMMARQAIKSSLSSLDSSDHVGFGCSGGADSLALLVALSTLYKKERAKQVHVIIVNHQLQEITDEISENTAKVASSYGFVPHIIPVDIVETSKGMESDARTARYAAFENAIDKYSLQAFLIGHTKTDQAEQVFLGLLRGSGTRSLSGIRKTRGVYQRPFIDSLSREDTQKVCEENNLDYWCDPHNDVLEYKRVSVRKMIKNVEKSTGQNIVEPLVRTAQISAEDAEALDFYAEISYTKAEEADWNVEILNNMPTAVRKRIYRKKLVELGANSESIGFKITNRIDELITSWHGQKEIYISNGVQVIRKNGYMSFNVSI